MVRQTPLVSETRDPILFATIRPPPKAFIPQPKITQSTPRTESRGRRRSFRSDSRREMAPLHSPTMPHPVSYKNQLPLLLPVVRQGRDPRYRNKPGTVLSESREVRLGTIMLNTSSHILRQG